MKGFHVPFLYLVLTLGVCGQGVAADLLAEGSSASYLIKLSGDPSQPTWGGKNVMRALVTKLTGEKVEDALVSFDLDMIRMSHGKNVVEAAYQGKGLYSGQVHFAMPGVWRVIIRVVRPGQEAETVRLEFSVKLM